MIYVVVFVIGMAGGISALLLVLWAQFQKAKERERNAAAEFEKAKQKFTEIDEKNRALDLRKNQLSAEAAARDTEHARMIENLTLQQKKFAVDQAIFNSSVISYKELREENTLLKRDLQNIDVTINKLTIDGEIRDQNHQRIDEKSAQLAKRYLNETVKSISSSIGPSNYSSCKQRLLNAVHWIREIGYSVPADQEEKLLTDLKAEFETAVKEQFEREEQARIKAQIYEEQRLAKEIDRQLKQIDRERAAIQIALDRALAEAAGRHSEEVELLKTRLADAEERARRTKSMAEQTKAGNVYIISNLGSFGENIFKIGMTRRLEPMERVNELGSASVPFPFDVHAMIRSDDAPALENALHRQLHKMRINKVNPRKEFFKVDAETILKIVREKCGEVTFITDPEASAYRQSLNMSDEDAAFIEQTYDAVDAEEDNATMTEEV